VEMCLEGQIAIISGGLGDIGRSIAVELAKRGADISLGDIQQDHLARKTIEEIEGFGVRVLYNNVDVTNHKAVRKWVQDTVDSLGGIPSLIIPNAGIVTREAVLDLTVEQWQNEFNVNLNGAFYLAQECAKKLVERQTPGKIVFIGSWAGRRPQRNIAAYCVTKAAISSLCRSMAIELSPYGILVNEVAPGIVNAGLSGQNFKKNPGFAETSIEKIPVRQYIEPEEVAWHVANLCNPENKNSSGTIITIDGGLSLTSEWSK
jgi:glucose 1-dehydrogenase